MDLPTYFFLNKVSLNRVIVNFIFTLGTNLENPNSEPTSWIMQSNWPPSPNIFCQKWFCPQIFLYGSILAFPGFSSEITKQIYKWDLSSNGNNLRCVKTALLSTGTPMFTQHAGENEDSEKNLLNCLSYKVREYIVLCGVQLRKQDWEKWKDELKLYFVSRSGCFSSIYFNGCMETLMVDEETQLKAARYIRWGDKFDQNNHLILYHCHYLF